MSSSRVELAVATAVALTAYALAFLPAGSALRWTATILAVGLAAAAFALRFIPASAGLGRWLSMGLRLLLVTIGSLVVFSRQFPLVRYSHARLTGGVVGGALALLALVFLAGRRAWRVHTHLVPALVGVLVAAGLERSAPPWYAALAGVAGLAVWVDAFRSGGPRRLGVPFAVAGATGSALAAALAWFLPVAQPHVQEMVARAYRSARTGLSDRSELGEIASLAESHRVVARVWTDRPQLMRMQVFAQFDGRRWVAFPRDGRRMDRVPRGRLGPLLIPVPGDVYSGNAGAARRGLTETRVLPDLWMDDGWGLLTPSGPLFLVWPHEGVAIDDRGLITTGGSSARLYGVMNRANVGTTVGPADPDLALPPRLDPRVRDLAASLQRGGPPGPALVSRTVDHLRTYYLYTLDVGRFRSRDPLAEFLFEKRAGYCEYFATATVILLRLQGVPARYVKGVSVRPESFVGSHYVVRESDAHAWADVWTTDTGWVEVDPTPSGGWALTHPDPQPGALAALWERVATAFAQAWARWTQGGWPWATSALADLASAATRIVGTHRLLLGAALAAAAILLVVLRMRRSVRRLAPGEPIAIAPELAAALQRVEQAWARAGSPRPPSRGLLEHLDGLPPRALPAELHALSERVVQAVYEAAFAGRPPLPADLRALSDQARALPR
jgi:Transglutaminase-like superfamily/TgpA N-terminal domain